MGALALIREDFESFRGEIKSRLDSMDECFALIDCKLDLSATFNDPQAYPSLAQLSEATPNPSPSNT